MLGSPRRWATYSQRPEPSRFRPQAIPGRGSVLPRHQFGVVGLVGCWSLAVTITMLVSRLIVREAWTRSTRGSAWSAWSCTSTEGLTLTGGNTCQVPCCSHQFANDDSKFEDIAVLLPGRHWVSTSHADARGK